MVKTMIFYKDSTFLKSCSDVFTSKNINETAWYGSTDKNSYVFDTLFGQNGGAGVSLRDFFESVYEVLLKHRRNEYVYKNTIIKKKLYGTYSPKTSLWIPEVDISGARADALFINRGRRALVYEIKTELDSLSRLNDQILSYYKCFPSLMLLVDFKHVDKALRSVPSSVGVSVLTKRKTVRLVRGEKERFDFLDSEEMFDFLNKKEREEACSLFELDVSGVSKIGRNKKIRGLFSKVCPSEMYNVMLEIISKRPERFSDSVISGCVPESLIAALYEYRIRKRDWISLIDNFDRPMLI